MDLAGADAGLLQCAERLLPIDAGAFHRRWSHFLLTQAADHDAQTGSVSVSIKKSSGDRRWTSKQCRTPSFETILAPTPLASGQPYASRP